MINQKDICLCDVDGVLAKFDLTLTNIINPKIQPEDIVKLNDWDIFKIFSKEEMEQVHKVLSVSDFWFNLPVYDHALKAIEFLRQKDFEVIFVTSPWPGCKDWADARKEWLVKHFQADLRKDIVFTHRKDIVYGDIFIDDRLDNVKSWHKKWNPWDKKSFLFETLSNQKQEWNPRIKVVDNKWKVVE